MFLEVNRIKGGPRHLYYFTRSTKYCQTKRLYQINIILLHFLANRPRRELSGIREKRKNLFTQGTIRENSTSWTSGANNTAELSPRQTIAGNQSTFFGRKNSNKASSSSNVDPVVGCSLKLFRSLARDCLATHPKGNIKVEISEL